MSRGDRPFDVRRSPFAAGGGISRNPFHPLERRQRGRGARIAATVLLGFLTLVFFRAQVLGSSAWVLRSESNRLRSLPVPAPRGVVVDRHGATIADNVTGYSIAILPATADSMRSTLDRLQPYLGITNERVEELLARVRGDPRRILMVDSDAEFDVVSSIEERRTHFPRVLLETRPRRRYLAGAALAHVTGYVGEVSSEELESPDFRRYEQGMMVGKDGVERVYERELQGLRGTRYVEVDARGRVVGSFVGQPGAPAFPGGEIRLNIDLELMHWIHRIFPDGMRGSVVALDVEDGGVLALYSSPAFDPNDFVGGIELDRWQALLDDPGQPLFNRAVMGRYAPGSTWKLASAAIALEAGVVSPDERMPISCTGSFRYGNRSFRCWNPEGHGSLDLIGALQHSCNVYFYQVGLRVGLDRMLEQGTRLGFGEQCGIDLPQEAAGQFPENRDYWEVAFGYRASEGEVLSLALGQGPNDQTPLKMAQFYAAIARDGAAPAPRLSMDAPPGEAWRLNLSDESLRALREGLRRVVAPGGTAFMSSLEHFDVMGKTGTAQNAHDRARPHAWFAGMAGPPDEDPEIVVVAIVEFGVSGSAAAAPLMAKVADFHLRRKYGIPQDTIQTLGEHLRAGRRANWAWTR